MCMKRECNEKLRYPWPVVDFIDLTMDEIAEDDDTADNTQRIDQVWNYHPYNLLPTDDEEEEAISYVEYVDDHSDELQYVALDLNYDLPSETNQNTNQSSAASLNINFNVADSNNTDEPNERHEFELNIPQILLSMSRISNNLYGQASTSQD